MAQNTANSERYAELLNRTVLEGKDGFQYKIMHIIRAFVDFYLDGSARNDKAVLVDVGRKIMEDTTNIGSNKSGDIVLTPVAPLVISDLPRLSAKQYSKMLLESSWKNGISTEEEVEMVKYDYAFLIGWFHIQCKVGRPDSAVDKYKTIISVEEENEIIQNTINFCSEVITEMTKIALRKLR